MTKICIVSPFAYGALIGSTSGHIGGVETQTAMLAKWLASNSRHEVSIITWNESTQYDELINGVKVIKLCRRKDGLPFIRFFYPRWSSLIKALKHADADVYYQNCAEYVTGQVALFCKLNNRKFVYSVASDPDCDPNLPTLRTFRERLLYRYGLRHSDAIITQTIYQKNLLETGFGLQSQVLPMPCIPPDSSFSNPEHVHDNQFRVLWVGRIASVKRVEILLEIAQKASDVIFEIAGGVDQEREYHEAFLDAASKLGNVIVHGKLNREQLNIRYRSVSAFCNTSIYEGFPNTFIEAWSYGLPVISTIDPDHLISQQKIGLNANTVAEFVEAIYSLKNNYQYWRELSANARDYFNEHHSLDNAMSKFLEIFETV